MFRAFKQWAIRRRRQEDPSVLGDKERAEQDRVEAANDSLFPGYGQTGARIWQDRTDREYGEPE